MDYDLLVIGFGKAGKTLASKMAGRGQKVALVEQDAKMNGGTCINIGCIPTKTLIHAAEEGLSFDEAMTLKETVVSRLNKKNTEVLQGAGVDLYQAKARFINNKTVELSGGDEHITLSAEKIVINTGSLSRPLILEGIEGVDRVYDSTGIQRLDVLPKRLAIIGGGNIGLEFASLYARLGSEVTVFEQGKQILSRYEPVAAQLAQAYLEEDGVSFVFNREVDSIKQEGQEVILTYDKKNIVVDAVLYALGRVPATQDLGLENTEIALGERGEILVDETMQTSVEGVYAVGDVTGGPQFTYVSLDDFRILFRHLTGEGNYTLKDRQPIATSLFINPPLSQVGLTESQAQEQGLNYIAKELSVANMPRAHVNNHLRGVYKVLVDPSTKQILGATLFGENSHEIINLIKMAMDNQIPYTYIQNQVFTHPTMAENLNDVFAI